MSRRGRTLAAAISREYHGGITTKSADASRLSALLEPLCSNYEAQRRLCRDQAAVIRKQAAWIEDTGATIAALSQVQPHPATRPFSLPSANGTPWGAEPPSPPPGPPPWHPEADGP